MQRLNSSCILHIVYPYNLHMLPRGRQSNRLHNDNKKIVPVVREVSFPCKDERAPPSCSQLPSKGIARRM